MNQGWIKVHRKILDNPIITRDNDYFRLWMHILLNATHDSYSVMFHNERIILKSGQFTTGRKILSSSTGIEESKVYRILNKFESEHMIEQVTDMKCTLITIINWDEYQNSEQVNAQVMNKCCTSDEQVLNTKQECKNVENVRTTHIYGEFSKVKLSDEEYQKLFNDLGQIDTEKSIRMLDEYKEQTGKKYKNDYLAIRRWVIGAVEKANTQKVKALSSAQKDDFIALDTNSEFKNIIDRMNI